MKIKVSAAALAVALLCAGPVLAQHQGHSMPMPAKTKPKAKAPKPTAKPQPKPAAKTAPAQDHSGHQMPATAPTPTPAQDHSQHEMPDPAPAEPIDHAAMGHDMEGTGHGGMKMSGMGSGTSRLPASEPMDGLHFNAGDWMLMAHGTLWGVYTDQGGPRGDEMAFVESMGMLTAERPLGDGARLQLRSMFSLEPLMGRRGYPNLFATGETANGEKLVDRQHPHDLFMELAARVDVDIAEGTSLFVYGGPVGEPALGPSAFMHRASAKWNPDSPITHHWFDSTHITYGVVTAGVSAKRFQLEASAFRGREPDEERWGIETPKLDSWSVRGTWLPTDTLAIQASYGRLESPEALHPDEDEGRFTASVNYTSGPLAATVAYSAKNRLPGETLHAWLGEATYDLSDRHSLFGRFELTDNDELFGHDDPLGDRTFRVGKGTLGYAYRLPIEGPVGVAIGGSASLYTKPQALDAAYGETPVSVLGFVKLTLE
jgi:hypothetical protein